MLSGKGLVHNKFTFRTVLEPDCPHYKSNSNNLDNKIHFTFNTKLKTTVLNAKSKMELVLYL